MIRMLLLFLCATAARGEEQGGLKWHDSVKSAFVEALREKKPVLLVAGAEWCGPCEVLEKEMARAEIAPKLSAQWTLVHLDVDRSEGAAAWLESGAIPLVRVLSPAGKRVAVKEGVMKGEDLLKWLGEHRDAALAAGGEELTGTDEPGLLDVGKLVKHLADADPTLREAAIKRLAPYPAVAAGAVAEAFAKGDLATRLACLDLLAGWKAPVEGIDPWRPETVNNETVKRLLDWALAAKSRAAATRPASKPATLPSAEREDARQRIARMILAGDDEARAIRERLARLGRALMPDVLAALKDAPTDAAREKLLALRYRLAAADSLVLEWPGGIERLASSDAQARRSAAEELVKRARSQDGGLLLELFADPDPLVREISLRGLQAAGGGDAGRALLELLYDPDLNVRAAVLKQLAEAPTAGVVTTVVQFAQKEKDPDLVVHAARVLREVKGNRAVEALVGLLSHESWRVRAEAAEALTEVAKASRSSNPAAASKQADIYTAMIKLLDDPDPFVVSRAVLALQQADTPLAVEPMAQAAAKHPDLTAEIIKAMTQGTNTRRMAEKHLRKFCSHTDPHVRAEAIEGLCEISGDVEKELTVLLSDNEAPVRTRAAASLFSLLESWRPTSETRTRVESSFFGLRQKTVAERGDPWQWVADFHAGKGGKRAPWMMNLVDDLESMTKAKDAEERLDAARALAALKGDPQAPGLIVAAAKAQPTLVSKAASVLPWLPLEKRLETFHTLRTLSRNQRDIYTITQAIAASPDPKAAGALWDMVGDKGAAIDIVSAAYNAVLKLYLGERYYDVNSAPAAAREELVRSAKKYAGEGTDMQRILGMAVLLNLSIADVVEPARKIYEDPRQDPALRTDAMQILLLAQNKAQGTGTAAAALASKEVAFKRVAARYLAGGAEELTSLRQSFYLNYNNPELGRSYVTQGTPVVLEPPAGITADMLRPLLKDADGETAACAGYLLALLGEREGFDAVLRHWRANAKDETAKKLTYRAIAALRDDSLTPILEEVYGSYAKQDYYVREFYWTIRVIGGEKVLLLRKKIRDEIGMDKLR